MAATITLLPPGAAEPLAGAEPVAFADTYRLSIDGPVKVTHHFVASADQGIGPVARAVGSGDPVILAAASFEYAPFWCRACALNYCGQCLSVWVEMDEGFYDCTRGRCPVGHEWMLDD